MTDQLRDSATGGEMEQPPASVLIEATGQTKPWEQIEAGRYMPRRIRGSFHGRELG